MRKLIIVIAAAASIVASSGIASAEEIVLPRVGRYGCEVNGGTVGVAEPGGLVTYNGFYVNPYFCLPPV
jgi:hypothetical protein